MLNRALLERQMLLRRRRLGALEAVERLVALQAQVPRDPYVALWSRLDPFRPEALSEAIADRRAVRMTLLRATLHLVTAPDALALRPLFQPVVERMFFSQRAFRRAAEGVDLDEVVALFRELLEERPGTRADLARAVAERWPDRDASSLGYAMYFLPTVQITPRGLWGKSGRAAVTTLERWLGSGPLGRGAAPQELVTRYLAVFGPATPADFSSWSGLAGVREVFEDLRPRLRTFRDEQGRELFDLPRAPLPDPETPAPVRFLPEYDNALLGHADRSRIIPEGTPQWTDVGWGTVLVDGFMAARWKLDREKAEATLRVEPFHRLSRAEGVEVTEEGVRLVEFLEPSGRPDVQLAEEIEPSAAERRPNSPRNR
ncbi:MAG TPA: winged helix DNA-binding domain-containing protein [Actinomycetota bacterium]|nr:winged helix DNA-binding domain-containing protein [Actinomycetota bacterium]